MRSPLHRELQMKLPFDSLETEVYLNLNRTHAILGAKSMHILKDEGLSLPQYNVLRILRGAGGEGLPSGQISERMVTRVPDVPRLIDRLMKQGLLKRRRCSKDRRIVYAIISQKGLALLGRLDKPVSSSNKQRFKHMTQKELTQLNDLLTKARAMA